MPNYLFLDRDGNEVGLITSSSNHWAVGTIVERPSGRYRVLEAIEMSLADSTGATTYVVVERADNEPARRGV